ncbi:hypothetical protein ACFDR9_004525, partial [Janthinobacterium sp. CG_23.3]
MPSKTFLERCSGGGGGGGGGAGLPPPPPPRGVDVRFNKPLQDTFNETAVQKQNNQ